MATQHITPFLSKIRRSHCHGLTLLLMLFWLMPAQAQELTAAPSQFSAAARIKVGIDGQATSTNYRLRLEQVRPGILDFDLLNFSSGTQTRSTQNVTIPQAPVGNYQIVLYRDALGLARVADVAVTVQPSLTIALTPNTHRPRKAVRIQVGNLSAGSLRVIYAGTTILGPVAVGDGSWTGKFVVPTDRPSVLPANVPVIVENSVGRTVVGRGEVVFRALAPNGLPRLGFTATQVPTAQLRRGGAFSLGGRLQTDDGVAPNGRQTLYFKPSSGPVIPVDNGVAILADGSMTVTARAPDARLDGYDGTAPDQLGTFVVVSQGVDIDTDAANTSSADGPQVLGVVDGRDAMAIPQLRVVVRGVQPGNPPLQNIFVEIEPDFRPAFTMTVGPAGPGGGDGWQAYTGDWTSQLVSAGSGGEGYGCAQTVYRQITNSQGRATFNINSSAIKDIDFARWQDIWLEQGDVNDGPGTGSVEGGVANDSLVLLRLVLYGAHTGYRSLTVIFGFNVDTGEVTREDGTPFISNTIDVLLERSPLTDFDLRNFRIDGLGTNKLSGCTYGQVQEGGCPYTPYVPDTWGLMYTYENTTKWPNNVFSPLPAQRNVGRKMRFEIDPAVYGPLTSGTVTIGALAPVNFVASQQPSACSLDSPGLIEFVATLPDMTRLPARRTTLNANGIVSGGVDGSVRLQFGGNPARTFPIKLDTQEPPTGVDVTNPNIRTLKINALDDKVVGTHNVPGVAIAVPSPGYGMGNLNNDSTNVTDFTFQRTPDNVAAAQIQAVSDNIVAGNEGGPRSAPGVYFGYTNNNTRTHPAPITLFDTGLIPLFRYKFGIPPIAEATLGADFWLRSELGFYGQLKTSGMDATIDPTVEGGVNIAFNLDILLGLASASISANSTIGVTMRSVVGAGGLPNQFPGECFTFRLDAVWEACAVGICGGGTEQLIRIPQNGCNGINEGLPGMVESRPEEFDLARPRYTATALASDGRGNAISLGLSSTGALVASHLSGTKVQATRTLAPQPVGVQHLDVAFYGSNKAMAVWSENTQTLAQLRSLMLAQGGRAFDDVVRTQRLRFSFWDGRVWSAPANLTSVGSDGKPQLAGCLPAARFQPIASACPSGGEVTAVWERDSNRNLDAPDIEVWSNTWRPASGWSGEARVSDTGVSSDMLPSVAYRNEVPVVVWAHNPLGHFVALQRRLAAYRFLDGSSPVRIANALGLGVGWVSLGVSPSDQLVIAYSRAQDINGFVGNRQALYAARSTSCASGSCNFLVTEPRDSNGRQFRIEHPSVSFDGDGTPILGFRGVGFGPDRFGRLGGYPGDPPGMLLGTGEVALVRVQNFSAPTYTAELNPLSANGLQHWKPEFVFDETMGGVFAVSMQAAMPAITAGPMKFAQKFSPTAMQASSEAKTLSDGSSLRTLGGGPDFKLRDARLSRSIVATGQTTPFTLTVDLINAGQGYDPAEHGSLRVVATWNAPSGAGAPAGTFNLTAARLSNSSLPLSMPLTIASGIRSDERQTLFVEILASDDANDQAADDLLKLPLNEMPIPQNVRVLTTDDSNMVRVLWDSATDARIAGWRVWKLNRSGVWRSVGSSSRKGYLDFTGRIGREQIYRVAAYSTNGIESEPSESSWGKIVRTDLIFENGLE